MLPALQTKSHAPPELGRWQKSQRQISENLDQIQTKSARTDTTREKTGKSVFVSWVNRPSNDIKVTSCQNKQNQKNCTFFEPWFVRLKVKCLDLKACSALAAVCQH